MSFSIDHSDDENSPDNTTVIKVAKQKKPQSLYLSSNAQLDQFLQKIYEFYVFGGLRKFALERMLDVLRISFIAMLFYGVTSCIAYQRLLAELAQMSNSTTATVTVPNKPMLQFSDYVAWEYPAWPFYPFAVVFGVYFCSMLINSAYDIRQMFAVRDFYEYELKIQSLETISWPTVVQSLSSSDEFQKLGLRKSDAIDIVGRITRRNNYFVAMLANENVLAASPSQQSVFLRKQNVLMCAPYGTSVRPIMTKTLQWALERTLFAFAFTTQTQLREEMAALVEPFEQIGEINNHQNNFPKADYAHVEEKNWLFETEDVFPSEEEALGNMEHSRLLADQSTWFQLVGSLATRFRALAIFGFVLAPFVLCFLIVDFVLEHGERWQRQPQNIFSARQWSADAQWQLLQYNEVPHLFQERMASAAPLAHRYIKSSPLPKTNLIAKFLSYCIGSIFLTLLFFGVVFDDDFFTRVVLWGNRSALWWLTLLGAALAILRALSNDDAVSHSSKDIDSPHQCFAKLQGVINHCPQHWSGDRCAQRQVFAEFQFLYEYRWVGWLRELVGIIYTPYLLWTFFPGKSERLLRFLVQTSVTESDKTHVCRYAASPYPFESLGQTCSNSSSNCEAEQTILADRQRTVHQKKIAHSRKSFEDLYD